MIKIKNYVKAESLAEAHELNQKKTNVILGGMLWLKQQKRPVNTAIDLSGLGLDKIEETKEEYRIGAMVTLRQLEQHEGLNRYSQNAVREAVKSIVGVQFRNGATVGGSVWGRFGFSDVLTVLMAMDSEVELYPGGRMPLEEFAKAGGGTDILTHVIIKKKPMSVAYLSQRNTRTDFPVLTCAVSLEPVPGTVQEMAAFYGDSQRGGSQSGDSQSGGSQSGGSQSGGSQSGDSQSGDVQSADWNREKYKKIRCVIGARPGRAICFSDERDILKEGITSETAEKFGSYIQEQVTVGSNMRAGAEYRRKIAGVLVRRALLAMEEATCR